MPWPISTYGMVRTTCPSLSMRTKALGAKHRRRRFGVAVCKRQTQAQHQASAGGRPGLRKLRRERPFAAAIDQRRRSEVK